MNLFERKNRFQGDPYSWLPRRGESGVTFIPMNPVASDELERFTSQIYFVEADPGEGVFIPNGEFGVTRDFGPCSAAILTGITDYVWLGHLKPGHGIPDRDLRQIGREANASTELHITLVGGCVINRNPMDSFRHIQVDTIFNQFAQAGLSISVHPYWNPTPDSWLFSCVQANQGDAKVTLAYEL